MEKYIKEILNKFKDLNKQQKIITLFELVRDIPYGNIGSRNPKKVWEHQKGTCSGKHLLLGKLYEAVGIKVKYMMCLSKFNFLQIKFPKDIQLILRKHAIPDYHNFLKIFNKKWITVDATFDSRLKKRGFPVNLNWDGKKNCIIAFKPLKVLEVRDVIAEKKRKLNELPKEIQDIRKDFINKVSKWMEKARKTQ